MDEQLLRGVAPGDLLAMKGRRLSPEGALVRAPLLVPMPGSLDQAGARSVKHGSIALVLGTFHDTDSSVKAWWFLVLCCDVIGWCCDLDVYLPVQTESFPE